MGRDTSRLVPTSVTDKNGRLTTVYKKSESPSLSSPTLSNTAPTLKAPEKEAFKASFRQQSVRSMMLSVGKYPQVEALESTASSTGHAFATCSDLAAFEVLAATTNTRVGALLLAKGFHTAEEAHEYLKSIGEPRFISNDPERASLMQSALERLISPIDVCRFSAKHMDYSTTVDRITPERYLDAVIISSHVELDSILGLSSAVMNGRVKFSDVMHVTPKAIGRITSRHLKNVVTELFEKCADESIDYDADDMKANIIKASTGGSAMYGIYSEYGVEGIKGMRGMASEIMVGCCNEDNLSKSETVEALQYFYKFENLVDEKIDANELTKYTTQEVYDLHRANVPVEFAVEKIRNNAATVNQVIAMHEGISSATSSGWL